MQNEKENHNKINGKKYNLKNDIIFQAFFTRKGNEIFLKDFLEALLEIDIKDLKIRDEVNLEKLSHEEKGGRLDLQALVNDKSIVSIEMQLKNQSNIERRITFYISKTVSKDAKRGTDYKDLREVISVVILNFNLLSVPDYISDTVTVLNRHRYYDIDTNVRCFYIELPKFRKAKPDMNKKLNQWLAFIDNSDEELVKMAMEKNKLLQRAKIELNYLTGDAELRRLSDLRDKWEMDRVSELSDAKEEGIEEGLEKGLKIGIEKGQKNEKIKIAKEMLKKDLPIDLISEITKLSKEEIEKLKI